MQCIPSPVGATVSYDTYGNGPPPVLVHGAFSDHKTNWEFVKPLLEKQFTVLLQIGTESPRGLYVTDALATVLPNARIQGLPGQAHEGMTTAPEMYAEAVSRFLLQ